jgi:hypothetical protein
LRPQQFQRPRVQFGDIEGGIVISSDSFLVARVPEGASSGSVVVSTDENTSNAHPIKVAVPVAENLHPVCSPAVDFAGNIYTTFSGSRGQKVPVAVYKIDLNFRMTPFINDMMNATGIAVGRDNFIYISSRFDGVVYQVSPSGNMTVFVEGMGVATGIVFDDENNLYVGDRSGTIFKIGQDQQVFVFATLEPSVSAYHLAFGPQGDLFVTGPSTSSFDSVHRIDPHGTVTTFYRGLGRPQGLAFDMAGNLYVAASLSGRRGIVKITADAKASLEVSGHGLVGMAFAPGKKCDSRNHGGGAPPLVEYPGIDAHTGIAMRQLS